MANRLTQSLIDKGVRRCRVCRQIKPLTEFTHDLNNKWIPSDCLECERSRHKSSYKTHRSVSRIKSSEVKEKPSSCEVCGSIIQICYDHCHLTNLHRGWLCHKCNTALGFADDDPMRLRDLARYLDNFH